SVGLNSK
ncbi:ubiquinone/menaquinone biosynthesis methyltransferase family protein, partial [Chlamydia psittaci 84-8471/1]